MENEFWSSKIPVNSQRVYIWIVRFCFENIKRTFHFWPKYNLHQSKDKSSCRACRDIKSVFMGGNGREKMY